MKPIILALFVAVLNAQETNRPKETLALLDQARSLPPEFCADVLLKLAGSRFIPDARWKRELIEEAYTAGAHAQLPYQRIAYNAAVDSRWNQEYASNGLEALALQTRAVDAMLDIDAQRAAAMFQDIVFPDLPKEKCDEPAVATVEKYYDTAAQVFARGFTAKQRQKEEDLQFMERCIARMQSPNQVPRVLRTILALKIGDDQRKRLLAAFAVSLDRISGGDRAFGALESILVPAHTPEISGTPMFLTALRAYIARHVSGPRCTDHLKVVFTDSVIRINALAYKVDPGAAWLKPISVDEAKPAKDDGTYPPQRPWASKRASDVLAALRWLDHGDTDPPVKLTPEQRKSQEWNDHFNDLLKLIEGWKVEEENSPEEYLINVALTYGLVAADAPPGAQKENVMGRYLNFLETRYAETANRNLWFAQVEALLRQAHYQREGADRAWILDHFARSASPIIALYGKIEEMLGPAKR